VPVRCNPLCHLPTKKPNDPSGIARLVASCLFGSGTQSTRAIPSGVADPIRVEPIRLRHGAHNLLLAVSVVKSLAVTTPAGACRSACLLNHACTGRSRFARPALPDRSCSRDQLADVVSTGRSPDAAGAADTRVRKHDARLRATGPRYSAEQADQGGSGAYDETEGKTATGLGPAAATGEVSHVRPWSLANHPATFLNGPARRRAPFPSRERKRSMVGPRAGAWGSDCRCWIAHGGSVDRARRSRMRNRAPSCPD
jgi:hypothetical protein